MLANACGPCIGQWNRYWSYLHVLGECKDALTTVLLSRFPDKISRRATRTPLLLRTIETSRDEMTRTQRRMHLSLPQR